MNTLPLPIHLIAWKFLRRNSEYRSNYRRYDNRHQTTQEDFNFPVFEQTEDDLAAARWGLLAFEHPEKAATNANPFWSIGPILDAETVPESDTPLLPMLRKSNAHFSGIHLRDDTTILAIRRRQTSVQIRLRGKLLPGDRWGISLQLPLSLKLPILLTSAEALWGIVHGETAKEHSPGF